MASDRLRAQIDEARRQVGAIKATSTAAPDGGVANKPAFRRDAFPGYELIRELHRGGQGIVFLALQIATQRQVALKVIREGPLTRPSELLRFRREVRILAQLRHPNIVAIHDSGLSAGCFYYSMEYVAGLPLDLHVRKDQPSRRDLLQLFEKVCGGVAAAHARGVIHRDLKPDNILVDAAAEPRILDFGLAHALDAAGLNLSIGTMTEQGQFVGSLPWASPEQVESSGDRPDVRSDVYALGVILYQVLTGEFPYPITGTMRQVMDSILTVEPARPSDTIRPLENDLVTIMLKALSKSPERRYQSAGELARDVRHFLAGEPIEARRDSVFYVAGKHARRYRAALLASGPFILLLIGSTIVAWGLYTRSQDRLYQAYLAEARATRAATGIGRRFDTLATLTAAAALRPSPELRNEAIAAMALADLQPIRRLAPVQRNTGDGFFLPRRAARGFYVRTFPNGQLEIRRLEDDQVLAVHPGFGLYAAMMAMDAEERWLAIKYHKDQTIEYRVIDPLTGDIVLQAPSTYWPGNIALSADGGRAAITQGPAGVHVYDLATAVKVGEYPVPNSGLLQFDRDGERLAVAAGERVQMMDSASGAMLTTLGLPAKLMSMDWSEDGTSIAAGCADFRAYIIDVETGKQVAVLVGHHAEISGIRFVHGGDYLLTHSWDRTCRLWDAHTSSMLLIAPDIFGWAADADPPLIIERDRTGTIATLSKLDTAPEFRTIRAHAGVKGPNSAVIAPDGRWMASCGDDGVRLWSTASRKAIGTLDSGQALCLFLDPAGANLLYSAGARGVLRWPYTLSEEQVVVGPPEQIGPASPARWAGAGGDGRIIVLLLRSGQWVRVDCASFLAETLAHASPARFFTLTSDDRWIAWVPDPSGDEVTVIDARSGEIVRRLSAPGTRQLTFSHDGSLLLASGEQHYAAWRVPSWEQVYAVVPPGLSGLSRVAISSDDRTAAAASTDGPVIVLFDPATGVEFARLEAPSRAEPTDIDFSRDGRWLLATGFHQLQLWDLRAIRRQLAAMKLNWNAP